MRLLRFYFGNDIFIIDYSFGKYRLSRAIIAVSGGREYEMFGHHGKHNHERFNNEVLTITNVLFVSAVHSKDRLAHLTQADKLMTKHFTDRASQGVVGIPASYLERPGFKYRSGDQLS
jgi:hypothetical protein